MSESSKVVEASCCRDCEVVLFVCGMLLLEIYDFHTNANAILMEIFF